jgi:hypothetical protein
VSIPTQLRGHRFKVNHSVTQTVMPMLHSAASSSGALEGHSLCTVVAAGDEGRQPTATRFAGRSVWQRKRP